MATTKTSEHMYGFDTRLILHRYNKSKYNPTVLVGWPSVDRARLESLVVNRGVIVGAVWSRPEPQHPDVKTPSKYRRFAAIVKLLGNPMTLSISKFLISAPPQNADEFRTYLQAERALYDQWDKECRQLDEFFRYNSKPGAHLVTPDFDEWKF